MNTIRERVINNVGRLDNCFNSLLELACKYPYIDRIENISYEEMLKIRKQSYENLRSIKYQIEKAVKENMPIENLVQASQHITNGRLSWDGFAWTFTPIASFALEYRVAIYETLKHARRISKLQREGILVK